MQFVKPMPFGEAVQKLGARTPIGSKMMSAEWSDVPVALRERAFFSSQVESIRFLQRGRDAIADFLQGNREMTEKGLALKMGSRAQFVEAMREFALKEGMGPLDQAGAGGLRDITSERRLGLIFDTQTRQANDYGYWRQGQDPDVLNEFPAQRFIRVVDVRQERDSHIPHEDQVYLKTDPIWALMINQDFNVPWGPWGWGCGHDVEDVDRDEAEQLGLLTKGTVLQPDTKYFNENLRASVKELDPDLLAKLKEELGEQLVVEGEELRWKSEVRNPKADKVRDEVPIRQSPVSRIMDLQVSGGLKEAVETALSAIDLVHDDGTLPRIPVKSSLESSYGAFAMREDVTGRRVASEIRVKKLGPWPALSFAHETGHFLDLEGIGAKGRMASKAGEAGMREVMAAARSSKAVKGLQERLATTTNARTRGYLRYLTSDEEIWARAYAQFIAERAGNATLSRDLAKAFEAEKHRQWSKEDFKPIAEAIERMFRRLGWMGEKS